MEKATAVRKVFCPKCKKRLMDVEQMGSGIVQMKCWRCNSISNVNLKTGEVIEIPKKT